MEGGHKTLLALERAVEPVAGRPGRPALEARDSRLNIAVVFTSVDGTLVALNRAGELAHSLGVRLTLLVPQIVPYPLPLETPPVPLDWNERRFSVIARQSPVETVVRIFLCRDRAEGLESVLGCRSIVVVGTRRRWWRTADDRLARRLRRLGHEVILADTE